MMLGSRMYYEFIDETPAVLHRGLTTLKKELEGHLAGRSESRPDTAVPLINVAPARDSRSGDSGHVLLDMTVDGVCAFCKQHSLDEESVALRKHSIDGRALCQLLR